jgi:transposase InsO family protein
LTRSLPPSPKAAAWDYLSASRWDVIQPHPHATAQTAIEFLDTLQHRMPFPIRAVQIDGGPEFAAEFEQACQQRGLHLFVLPPRSPKLNGAVEPANRTHTEEFYQVTACSLGMNQLNRELRHREKIYNTVRPHQALGYLTSLQSLRHNSSNERNEKCHLSTGRVQGLAIRCDEGLRLTGQGSIKTPRPSCRAFRF